MKKHMSLFAAAAIAVGGIGLSSSFAQDAQQTQQRDVQTQQRDGVRAEGQVDIDRDRQVTQDRQVHTQDQHITRDDRAGLVGISEGEANNIRGTISTATEAALTQGELGSMAQRFTSSDEARFTDVFDREDAELDRLVQQLRDAFETRYGQDFSIDDREAVYPVAQVPIQAGLTQEAMLAGHRDQQDMQQDRQPGLQQDQQVGQQQRDVQADRRDGVGERLRPAGVERDDRAAQDENVATVIFLQTETLPEVHVPLVNEGTVFDAWRIDVPTHVDADTIRTNLHSNFSKALEQQAQWPADINQAYRMATHLVMMSVLDIQDDEAAQPAAGQEHQQQQPGM
jgi:hypothetical protein